VTAATQRTRWPRASWLFLAAWLLVPAVLGAQQARPALSAGRVLGETLGGAYAGIGGFVIGRYLGERTGDIIGVQSDDTRSRIGFASGVLLGGLATAGTVYGIGNIGDQTGEFDATYLGTGIGFVAALGLARLTLGPAERPREGISTAGRWAMANVVALLPALGATIAFNSSRRAR
jgi:hypothetical protein